MPAAAPPPPAATAGPRRGTRTRRRQRGQVLAIFAGATILFVGILAIVIDVSWYWANSLRVQRAADAAALAGVVWLPGNLANAQQAAYNEAAKDGYTAGGSVTITAQQDSSAVSGGDPNQLDVTVTTSVNTFFMRLFGIDSINATRSSKALYVLPVPMGSPQNYYGDFGKVRYTGSGEQVSSTQQTTLGPSLPTASGTATWTTPQYAYSGTATQYATVATASKAQTWTTFGFSVPSGATVLGLQVQMTAKVSAGATCTIAAALSWNNGTTYSTAEATTALTTTAKAYGLGGSTDTWGHGWSPPNDLKDGKFIIKLTNASACGSNTVSVRQLQVSVIYQTTTTTTLPDANLTDPNGGALAPQGFWGTIMSEGGESNNGDIYSPYYDNNSSKKTNPYYNMTNYYNYEVVMPAGSSAGQLWVYDAPFCAGGGNGQYGTGDRWFSGTAGISTFYDLYDTKLTTDTNDDTLVWSSGNTFKETTGYSDSDMGGSGGTSCSKDTTSGTGPAGADGLGTQCTAAATSGIDCHLRWYQVPVTLTGGVAYRLHVSTTDPNNASAQRSADGHNSFALWATATGGSPHVYGEGAMETFEPLPGGGASIFYLAQIGAEHAGKTMQIQLWDPGDTSPLPAALEILAPTATGYQPTAFSWTAQKINSQGQSCTSTGTNVTSVTTNVGNTTGTFNGCWLTINVALPSTYDAPTPPGETNGGGWWKIQYDMGGSSSTSAFDLTTWQVSLLGNPVHLVVP